jgi:hypothetical protein
MRNYKTRRITKVVFISKSIAYFIAIHVFNPLKNASIKAIFSKIISANKALYLGICKASLKDVLFLFTNSIFFYIFVTSYLQQP